MSSSRAKWLKLSIHGVPGSHDVLCGTQEVDSSLRNRTFENSLCSSTHTTLYSIAHITSNHCTHYAGGALRMFFKLSGLRTVELHHHTVSFATSYMTNCRGCSNCTVAFRTPCIIRSTINNTSYSCIVFYIPIMPPVR